MYMHIPLIYKLARFKGYDFTPLSKWSNITSATMVPTDIMCVLLGGIEKDTMTVSPMLYPCEKCFT